MQTHEQVLSRKVYDAIVKVEAFDYAKKYGRVCLRFPVLLHRNGLAQTLAFFQAKGAGENHPQFGVFLNDLASVVGVPDWSMIHTIDTAEYLRLTRSAHRAGDWFKRYAEAILKVDPAEENDDRG